MDKIWLKQYPAGIGPEIDPNLYTSIMDVFDESCRKYGPQISFKNMGVSLTYDELANKADQFASFLQNELKLKKGDRIALQMPKNSEGRPTQSLKPTGLPSESSRSC